MTFVPTRKGFFASLQTVAILAILHFLPTISTAQSAISMTPLKGDALYIGVDNPIQVKVDGIANDKVYLASDGVEITNMGNGLYNVRITFPGKVTFTVHGEGFQYKNFDIESKYVSDPLAALKLENGSLKMDAEMTAQEFKKAVGLGFETSGYNGKIQLDIASYKLVRVPKVGDPTEVPLHAANFNDLAKSLINAAQPGDRYYFEEVQANVEGTANPRKINSLFFQIK